MFPRRPPSAAVALSAFVQSALLRSSILLVVSLVSVASAQDLKIEFAKVLRQSTFKSESHSIWGGSLVKGDDGWYHLFYSRWPKHLGWAWVTDSEVAHAVSDSPFGPFQFKDVALPRRGREFWDGWCTHNPTVHRFGDKYYLYYMGNTGDGMVTGTPGKEKLNWNHRNNQRIGVAVADSPNGPWVRSDKPLLDVSRDEAAIDSLMTSNPSVCQRPDGGFLMVYKAVGKEYPMPNGGPVVHGVATSDHPTGPFKKHDRPIFTFQGERFPAEDPYIWHQNGKYRAIVKRIKHEGKQRVFSLVHYDSVDGFDWKPAKHHEISERIVQWEDGTVEQFEHLERPQVYLENGVPIALLCAADTRDANRVRHSFNIQIPLRVSLMPAAADEPAANDAAAGFPYVLPKQKPDRPLSEAMRRNYDAYPAPRPEDNELYTRFKYTPLKGLDDHGGDGTVSRRDPSKVIFENGKYYVWYTKRNTPTPPQGPDGFTDTIPSSDWDLADIWYATSEDGFSWDEQGVAVARPEKPLLGWRSVSTPDILVWKGKYYLYYQGFSEASGTRGDDCPVAVSYADSPDGPWTAHHQVVLPNGAAGQWDQYSVHDPYPLVYRGKIYLYYKSDFDGDPNLVRMQGLAIADDPLGPFKKHPLNPVINSGHETTLFPFRNGIAAFVIRDGLEHSTIQYAPDGVHFKIASIVSLMPNAGGPFIPDAFTDTQNGRGITWGLSHFTNVSTWDKNHAILARFDCDLSLDVNDPEMKRTGDYHKPDVFFEQRLSSKQKARIEDENKTLMKP
ncbi:Glycosyl hydrolases family 43 [Stieleria magnilauensis]|uniref:Glycosyl hydrolases family 43 n=2 Tax=Stieleria magnilauensis TaxID=2527963 RepID=A0ABX5XWN7_9BACT|nr:Glycosyl hydrolases family 43 [Planctomycetes bacterium TBK1r]